MKYLLLSTLQQGDQRTQTVFNEMTNAGIEVAALSTANLKISHCIGCNDCWIKTPGRCCIKDDYEQILINMLQSDRVLLLTEARLGFVSSQMKHLIDRILPLATMHLRVQNGQMRHDSRYGSVPDMGLLYVGSADKEYLNLWMGRVQLNMHGESFGAYEFADRKELYHALGHHQCFAS